uniref:Uncharacterized protein n=2 Tax=Macaca fascicularis TaxID=9541 RepID=A0A7N9IFY4_MACFA
MTSPISCLNLQVINLDEFW